MDFSNLLILWYLSHRRDLPWRETQNPYAIWLSEIMLQQTRVAQALPYYYSFLKHFPTVNDLAKAEEELVLKLWQGLGYYSRARNMHATAKQIVELHQGAFPPTFESLKKLKGIGDYTAAAIASFAFGLKHAVVDGNVYRVLSRYYGINTDIASSKGKFEFSQLANELIPEKDPALFNQAIMEFGAVQCVPKNPDCLNCVFAETCFAFRNNKVGELPVKLKKTKVQKRFFNYVVLEDDSNQTVLQKRSDTGIWANMYEFPLVETLGVAEAETVYSELESQFLIPLSELNKEKTVIHKLSHQHLNITFWKAQTEGTLLGGTNWTEVNDFPVPVVIANYIEERRQRK